MLNTKANVAVFYPNRSVLSMADENEAGMVREAVEAAVAAFRGVDSDNRVPTVEYGGDFDDAIVAAEQFANGTEGLDILVVVTDFQCDDPQRAISTVRGSNNMFVLVPCSNQGYDEDYAKQLDADHEGDNNVDVVSVKNLSNPEVALKEVTAWLNSQREKASA